MTSWASTQTYSNVSIAFESIFGPFTGTAYLMTQIGPGTTTAQQVATSSYSVASSGLSLTSLFTGLSLGPGTYFLVVTSTPASPGGWDTPYTAGPPVVTTAAGVTRGAQYIVNDGNGVPNLAYPPASTFSALNPVYDLKFQVTGTLGAGGCPPHTTHFHISTVPPGHFGGIASHQHHGQHGHTIAADCPPHAPGHSPGLMSEPEEGLPSTSLVAVAPDFVVALNQDGVMGPAARGTVLQLFGSAAGLFLADQDDRPAVGLTAPSSGSPPYYTTSVPAIRIDGLPAKVLFSGLAPGLTGVWQINVLIPAEAPAGDAVPLTISYEGDELTSVAITVR